MRRDFDLPTDDLEFLESHGIIWETVRENGMDWVVIKDHPVPFGYNVDSVSVAIKIETGYPRTPLDMAYFYPAIARLDGKAINATTPQKIAGCQFQRWSRHRTQANPWRPGTDDLSTHLALISFWFEAEFKKHPNGVAA
jgi:hypothetical protein